MLRTAFAFRSVGHGPPRTAPPASRLSVTYLTQSMIEKEDLEKKNINGQNVTQFVQRPSKLRLLLCLACGITFTSLFLLYITFDMTVPYLKFASRVAEGSAVHKFLRRETDMAHFSAYLFNITNAQEFMAGEHQKLKLQEVGPFTYRELRKNDQLELDLKAGVIRYSPHINLTFIPEESIARPEDVIVTMPNIPMLGVASNLNKYGYLVRSGFNMLAGPLKSKPIVTMDASKYMFGYHEPLVYLGNKVIPGFVSFDKMGFLARLYANDVPNHLEVSARDEDKFMIKSRNGQTVLTMSENQDPDDCTKCSTFQDAYEGMVYPSGLSPDFNLRLFRNGLCKIMDMKYLKTKTMDYGGDALVYRVDDKFFDTDSETKSDGNLLLPECFYNMPLALSKAHFLDMDPKIYANLEGIKPDKEKHISYVIIDPKIGLEIETKISIQINLVLGDVRHNKDSKSFANMVLPICYMRIIQPPLSEENQNTLRLLYSIWPKILIGMQVILGLLAVLSWTYFVIYLNRYRRKSDNVNVMVFPLSGTVKCQKVPVIQPLMEKNSVRKR